MPVVHLVAQNSWGLAGMTSTQFRAIYWSWHGKVKYIEIHELVHLNSTTCRTKNSNTYTHMWTLISQLSNHKQLETYVCIISTVATDGLVLKHQAISIHNADFVFIVLPKIYTKILLHLLWTTPETKIMFWKKKWSRCLRIKHWQSIIEAAYCGYFENENKTGITQLFNFIWLFV